MHIMSILCLAADTVSSGYWFTVSKVLILNVAMLTINAQDDYFYPYLPTPLLGQDMTQGQFLSRVYQV